MKELMKRFITWTGSIVIHSSNIKNFCPNQKNHLYDDLTSVCYKGFPGATINTDLWKTT